MNIYIHKRNCKQENQRTLEVASCPMGFFFGDTAAANLKAVDSEPPIKRFFGCFDATMLLKLLLSCVLPMFNRRSIFFKEIFKYFLEIGQNIISMEILSVLQFFWLVSFLLLQKYNVKFKGFKNYIY